MKVAVVLGGTNEERNVSLATGRAVVAALRERGHEVVAVDPAHGAVLPEEEPRMLGGAVGVDPPGLEELAHPGHAELHPGGLDVVDEAVVGDAAHGVHQHHLPPGGAPPGHLTKVDRRRHVDEGQADGRGEIDARVVAARARRRLDARARHPRDPRQHL